MKLQRRDIQTKVKHLILVDYMAAWSGIILSGLSSPAQSRLAQGLPFESRLVFVDGFSYKGRYSGDVEHLPGESPTAEPIWGSPILGVQALDRAIEHGRHKHGFEIETAAVLVERDAENYGDLLENLRLAGLSDRVVDNPDTIAPRNGEIVVLRADFRERYPEIINLLQAPYTKSFVFLDPRGVSGIPYEMVRRFISIPHADVMINWLFLDVQRRLGRRDHAAKSSLDAMFGGDAWRRFEEQAIKAEDGEGTDLDLERRLAGFYRERLQEADADAVIKFTRLDFPDRDRTMFYLFLTTHDPSGGLTLNEVLDDARLSQFRMRWNRSQDTYVRRQEAVGQAPLFDTTPLKAPLPSLPTRSVSIAELAAAIYHGRQGRTTTRKEIYRSLVNSEVYVSEIDRALTVLKREGSVEFSSKKINDPIRFAPKGGAP